jgi:hypothetical protein
VFAPVASIRHARRCWSAGAGASPLSDRGGCVIRRGVQNHPQKRLGLAAVSPSALWGVLVTPP